MLKRFYLVVFFVFIVLSFGSFAHGVDSSTQSFLENSEGIQIMPFMYIGAKHMVTGYDHLLFLVGVIFFLFKTRDILLYVSIFTLGHSLTLMTGVLFNISVNAYLIDAIIGLSVVYKAFDNLGGFKRVLGYSPNAKAAIGLFGLFHGLGLATKIQDFNLGEEGLLENLIAFNVGVEIGQFLALAIILLLFTLWRRFDSFRTFSNSANTLLMAAGFVLIGMQLTGYFL